MEDKIVVTMAVRKVLSGLPLGFAGRVESARKDENWKEPDFFRKPTQGVEHWLVQFLPAKTERRLRGFICLPAEFTVTLIPPTQVPQPTPPACSASPPYLLRGACRKVQIWGGVRRSYLGTR